MQARNEETRAERASEWRWWPVLISGLHGGGHDHQLPRICLCDPWLLLGGPSRAAYLPPTCLTKGKLCAQLRISLRIHHQVSRLPSTSFRLGELAG